MSYNQYPPQGQQGPQGPQPQGQQYPPQGPQMPQGNYPYPPPPKRSSPWPWIVGLGCGIPILLIGGCLAFVGVVAKRVVDDPQFKKSMADVRDMGKNTAAEKVEVIHGVQLNRDAMGLLHVKGKIRNKTSETILYLQVRLYGNDKSGTRIDEALTNTSDLAAHKVWGYDLTFTKSKVAKVGDVRVSTTPLDDSK